VKLAALPIREITGDIQKILAVPGYVPGYTYMDCSRPSNLDRNPKGAAVACLSSIAKAISQVETKSRYISFVKQ